MTIIFFFFVLRFLNTKRCSLCSLCLVMTSTMSSFFHTFNIEDNLFQEQQRAFSKIARFQKMKSTWKSRNQSEKVEISLKKVEINLKKSKSVRKKSKLSWKSRNQSEKVEINLKRSKSVLGNLSEIFRRIFLSRIITEFSIFRIFFSIFSVSVDKIPARKLHDSIFGIKNSWCIFWRENGVFF